MPERKQEVRREEGRGGRGIRKQQGDHYNYSHHYQIPVTFHFHRYLKCQGQGWLRTTRRQDRTEGY